ncbi:ABC transporter substrate-binding protein [Microvirga sp. TS319]|uniref:ABC transporter substrate-binding protein n=1 Tax=Microvirga sp. TS319 TaxID=3241165 RepID=UPI00351A88C9
MFDRGSNIVQHSEKGAAAVLEHTTFQDRPLKLLHWFCRLAAALVLLWAGSPEAAETVDVRMAYLAYQPPAPPSYEIDPTPEDEGLAGGSLAVRDNNTTGAFTGQHYSLVEAWLAENEDPVAKARTLVEEGIRVLIVNLPASELLAVADALKDQSALVFNVGATDDRLRGSDCRKNVLHVAPSRAMLTDALAQFLAFRRWSRVFLVTGPQAGDRLYADAMKRSARKLGLSVVAERPWEFGPLARAKADAPTTAEALVFTRDVDYQVLVVADEAGDFGDYLPYRTWQPLIVAGTQGLTATTWHPTLEAWGAAQAQNRFRRMANRPMRPLDYQTWMAVRAVGEAITQGAGADPADIGRMILDPQFGLPAYKGVSVSFRSWDHQLRQPILVVQPRFLVSVAPENGFLHQRTPLDTLGIDEPESECRM